MKNNIQVFIAIIILILSVLILVASSYYKINYAEQTFDNILYHMTRGAEKANYDVIGKGVKDCIFPLIFLFVILVFPISEFGKSIFSIKIKNKTIQIYPANKFVKHRMLYAITVLIVSLNLGLYQMGVFDYLKLQIYNSTIFEDEYIAGENVKITFPEEKRNLIYIFLEATETTIVSKENGGAWEYSIVPELEELAVKNINFSNTEKLGGAIPVYGTGWTMAGMLSQTAGIPLKTNLNNKGGSSFLPGVYSLGDILQKEGYNLKLMVGSDAGFGGRKEYFISHGNYEIFDLYTAIDEGKMKAEDEVWWGYEDLKLFKWAKEEILEMAAKDEPFNFTMLTVDTHFYDGYLSENAEIKYEHRYENVFYNSSRILGEFIDWIKKQEFYNNTTIVIVGDHLGMQTDFYKTNIDKDYTRTIFNTIINSAIPETNSKNRQFSTLDMFPTVLASMGAEIEGDRLGLGTNLFSGKPTLIEKYGFDYFNNELAKKSTYYNIRLLQDDYFQMMEN